MNTNPSSKSKASPISISVIINNYNYAGFVVEAVKSAQAQTRPPHEVIVVDDGSTDTSMSVLESEFGTHPSVKIVSQKNCGQLAAMRRGIELATGDWCFFLDADDSYLPTHLEEAERTLQAHPEVAFYCSNHRESSGGPLYHYKWPEGVIGPVAALVYVRGHRFGTITSALGLKRTLAYSITDLDSTFDQDWRIRADDCLVFGASLAGAMICYNPEPTVTYRIHGNNSFAGSEPKDLANYHYQLLKNRLLKAYAVRYGLEDIHLLDLLWREMRFESNHRHTKLKHAYLKGYRRAPGRLSAKFRYSMRTLFRY